MAGLLSGLSGLGLGNLEKMDIFETDKKEEKDNEQPSAAKVDEKDLVYDKTFECAVCGKKFTSKVMKTGRAKMLGTDSDLRPRYEGIDAQKYDVELCPYCGYAALSRYFPVIGTTQAKLVRENISKKIQLHPHQGDIYTYEEALERYKLTLANAVVKRGKASEKAYICLKSAWLLRGYAESLSEDETVETAKLDDIKNQEEEYLTNAFNGFAEARKTEGFPMCGMDEVTVDYLLASLATHFKKYDVASRLVASILTSASANARTKEKARELKEQILLEIRRK